MHYDKALGSYILASGRCGYANRGILGLGPDVTDGIREGYDGGFLNGYGDAPLTRAEREEIANEMIRRWTEWRDLLL